MNNPNQPNTTVSQQELISKAFIYLNSFKRHRALAEIKRHEGEREAMNYNMLKMYQMVDNLELALRAIQRGQRALDEPTEDDNS